MPGRAAPSATRLAPESESRVTEEALAAIEHRSASPASAGAIPVIDVGRYLDGASGSLETVAGEIRFALENIGFFVIVNHDVSRGLVERTFEQARRIHGLDAGVKMSLRMNEHNNGYMAMARYTVRTAEVNAGAAPDLNEAFFVKRERPPDDPLRRSGRRYVGPNVWPDGHGPPGFRENVLAYTDAMDRFGRRMLPAVAAALDLAPHWFDSAFEESQFSFRLSHYPPVTAGEKPVRNRAPHRRELHDLSPAVGGSGPGGADAVRGMGTGPGDPGFLRGQLGRHAAPVERTGGSDPPRTAPVRRSGRIAMQFPSSLGRMSTRSSNASRRAWRTEASRAFRR